MDRAQKPVASPDAVLREEFDDWAVLFNPDTADAVGLNPVGAAVWKQLDGARTLDEVIASVQVQFADVPGTVAEEITQFVESLAERGFVSSDTAGGS